MKSSLAACVLVAVVAAGCVSERDASYAPGGTKTVVPFVVNIWQAPVLLANHLFHDHRSGVTFDIQITSIDGKAFEGDGQRTKYYYQVDPGPHLIAVSCNLAKVKWVADFDFVMDPGDSAEITGELTEKGLILWFADVKTGKPVSTKVTAVEEGKRGASLLGRDAD
ncbi:MAG: hypothetical protein ABIZ81_08915 [Opitutaceae bacterium]